jgi:hypothetical protein
MTLPYRRIYVKIKTRKAQCKQKGIKDNQLVVHFLKDLATVNLASYQVYKAEVKLSKFTGSAQKSIQINFQRKKMVWEFTKPLNITYPIERAQNTTNISPRLR